MFFTNKLVRDAALDHLLVPSHMTIPTIPLWEKSMRYESMRSWPMMDVDHCRLSRHVYAPRNANEFV